MAGSGPLVFRTLLGLVFCVFAPPFSTRCLAFRVWVGPPGIYELFGCLVVGGGGSGGLTSLLRGPRLLVVWASVAPNPKPFGCYVGASKLLDFAG